MRQKKGKKKGKSKKGCLYALMIIGGAFLTFFAICLIIPSTRSSICTGYYYLKKNPKKLFYEIEWRLSSHKKYPYIPQGSNYYYGIDVSHYQSNVNWENVRIKVSPDKTLPVSFAYIKATEGVTITDKKYNKHRKEAENANIPTGSYHVFCLTSTPEKQADTFIKTVKVQKGDLRPVLDIEDEIVQNTKGSVLRSKVLIWLNLIEKKYGCKPILYMGQNTYKTFFYQKEDFKKYDFWIARYSKNEPSVNYIAWQFSDYGKMEGISGRTDLNLVKNKENFNKLFY